MTDSNLDDLIGGDQSSYYQVSDFNNFPYNNNLMILHQNIRSFERNYDSFSVFIRSIMRKIDIIVLTARGSMRIIVLIFSDTTPFIAIG